MVSPARPVHAETAARVPAGSSAGSSALRLADVVDALIAPAAELIAQLPDALSPTVAPEDVLGWLATAVGLEARHLLDTDRTRRILAGPIADRASWSTAAGLRSLLELRYGVAVRVTDSGSTTWSAVPGSPPPGEPPPFVTIQFDMDDDPPGIEELLRYLLPAHVDYRVITRRPVTNHPPTTCP